MNVEVNYLAVVLSVVAAMVVGMIWYAPKVFGDTWKKLGKIEGDGSAVAKPIAFALVANAVTAYVLAHVAFLSQNFFQNSFQSAALQTAFWLFVGFSMARQVINDGFESRPMKFTAINIGCDFVTLMLMGAIIGWFGV